LIVLRACIGVPLLGATGLIAGLSIDLAIAEPEWPDRLIAALVSLVFAGQAYVICKIFLFHARPIRIPRFRFASPPDDSSGFEGALVPAPRRPKLPTLSAAADLPKETLA
jgi:hypothetical protein